MCDSLSMVDWLQVVIVHLGRRLTLHGSQLDSVSLLERETEIDEPHSQLIPDPPP